jgi:hypothetical protein
VFSPKKWLHGLQNIAIWQRRLLTASHTLLLNGPIRKKKTMIKIAIEVRSSAARYKVALLAESIEGALEMAKRYNPGKECKVMFPIDPQSFFVR